MTEVILHIYDVTNSGSEKTNSTIMQINKIFKDGIGLGGIFHSAVQVYGDDEWSFGFCNYGTGVFSCPSKSNPMYTFRESMVLGRTNFPIFKVDQVLRKLSREWPGSSYDLLSKNCNHFCDELCDRLGVQKLPGWVNRFANAGDAALEVAGNTALRVLLPIMELLLRTLAVQAEEPLEFKHLGSRTLLRLVPNHQAAQKLTIRMKMYFFGSKKRQDQIYCSGIICDNH
uniref:PPPDE domain-containing protein n=2 Tax=Rhizophora mucronata TaxID=61149 RepID=A0A2P2JU90_RHIMU